MVLSKAARPLVRLVDRYLPDPYVLLLTLVVFIAAMGFERHGPFVIISIGLVWL